MRRVLVTGAAGAIGTVLRKGLAGRYDVLRLTDIAPLSAGPGEECVAADIRDLDAMTRVMQGIDCVVHLAGQAREAAWDLVLERNIIGTYNVFEAARRAGVKRLVYASSHHAIGFYRRYRKVGIEEPPRPDGRYGVSKVFGEATGRLYADKHGLSVAALRIGAFREKPDQVRHLSVWLSHGDMVRLARCCIEAPAYHFLVIYGVSRTARPFWDNPDAKVVGYDPQDNAEDHAAEILAKGEAEHPLAAPFHGGHHCPMEYDGDPARID